MEVGRTKALAHFGGDDVMKILILAIMYNECMCAYDKVTTFPKIRHGRHPSQLMAC